MFPQTELGTFMSMSKRDKERQIQELTMIVTGIRLFNKECGKGGEGIDDCKYDRSLLRCNVNKGVLIVRTFQVNIEQENYESTIDKNCLQDDNGCD